MKAEFKTALCWKQIGLQQYILTEPLRFYSALVDSVIEAPIDFVTDGESSPRWLPIINSLFGNVTNEGAVVHDRLYFTAQYPRIVADKILLEAMDLIPGLSNWRKYGIYYGLRIAGWVAWNAHRKAGHPDGK